MSNGDKKMIQEETKRKIDDIYFEIERNMDHLSDFNID